MNHVFSINTDSLVIDELKSLFRETFNDEPSAVVPLRAHGSDRKLFRLFRSDGFPVVGVYGPDAEENRAFLSFTGSFRSIGLPVPELYAARENEGIYLEEDLGDTTLFDALKHARGNEAFPMSMLPVYRRILELLPRFQIEGGAAVNYDVAYPHAAFDRRSMNWDLNYFKYHFLKLLKVPFNEARLEADFEHLIDFLLEADCTHFLYRDFQSRNIMLRGELPEPWFIDYQGGRRGALQYDVASLLYDAKAGIPEEIREELLHHYLAALREHLMIDADTFLPLYRGYVLIRIMQAMGAYGYRGLFEGKEGFAESIPHAVANVRTVMAHGFPLRLPELERAFAWIADAGEEGHGGNRHSSTARASETPEAALLVVRLTSFSFKSGYPEDRSGHGGGFVFDCRWLHNPGRYEEYRSMTGLEAPVVEFLEREEGTERFWRSVAPMIEGAVENYLDRSFSNLSVAFGCTGGRHRSVYFAERLARHLRERYPDVTVEVVHREREKWPTGELSSSEKG